MSAVSERGIGPVSVRYAAQIRELLQSQAVDRMVAEEEAARAAAEAEKVQRLKPAEDVKPPEPTAAKPVSDQPDPLEPSSKGTAQFVNIQV